MGLFISQQTQSLISTALALLSHASCSATHPAHQPCICSGPAQPRICCCRGEQWCQLQRFFRGAFRIPLPAPGARPELAPDFCCVRLHAVRLSGRHRQPPRLVRRGGGQLRLWQARFHQQLSPHPHEPRLRDPMGGNRGRWAAPEPSHAQHIHGHGVRPAGPARWLPVRSTPLQIGGSV